jgi:hypothetical protein
MERVGVGVLEREGQEEEEGVEPVLGVMPALAVPPAPWKDPVEPTEAVGGTVLLRLGEGVGVVEVERVEV